MKKTFKSLAAFLLLFALLAGIKPVQPPFGTETEPVVSVCGDDDSSDIDIIASE